MRQLEDEEITILEEQGCTAEDWSRIFVDDEFTTGSIHNVKFYGTVTLGAFIDSIIVDDGHYRRPGITNAVLRDVTIGDNCLIENVSGYISGCVIGNSCQISNVGIISSTGEGVPRNIEISVLNENGENNVVIFDGLTAQLAYLMIQNSKVYKMVKAETSPNDTAPQTCEIGEHVHISFCRELNNVIINDYCEVEGASRISNTILLSSERSSTYIGSDVIIENSVVANGASVTDGSKAYNCYIGESSHIGKGFIAESSLFFSNTVMECGEARAAFCGPFTVSRFKSAMLASGIFSFHYAGNHTQQANNIYKMGSVHWGTFDRGCKTFPGSIIYWPARIGAYSIAGGEITEHPDLRTLPFSKITNREGATYIEPGVTLCSAGLWQDVNRWSKRDTRPEEERRDIINTDFLNPYIIQKVIDGKELLQRIVTEQGDDEEDYTLEQCYIERTALLRGIRLYDMAIKLFIHRVTERGLINDEDEFNADQWLDLEGLLAPRNEIVRLLQDVENGTIDNTAGIIESLEEMSRQYDKHCADYATYIIKKQLGDKDDDNYTEQLAKECAEVYGMWIKSIKHDAEKEYNLGDISEPSFRKFLSIIK